MKLTVYLALVVFVPYAYAAGCACNFNSQDWMGTMTIKTRSATGSGPFFANHRRGYFKATIKEGSTPRYIYTDSDNHAVCYRKEANGCATDEDRPFQFPTCIPDDVPLKTDLEDEDIECDADIYQRGKESDANYARYEVTVFDNGTCVPKKFVGRDSHSSHMLVTFSDITVLERKRGRKFYVKEIKPFSDYGVKDIVVG